MAGPAVMARRAGCFSPRAIRQHIAYAIRHILCYVLTKNVCSIAHPNLPDPQEVACINFGVVNCSKDLIWIQSPHCFVCDFRRDKTFATCLLLRQQNEQSSNLRPSTSPVVASAFHLAINSRGCSKSRWKAWLQNQWPSSSGQHSSSKHKHSVFLSWLQLLLAATGSI